MIQKHSYARIILLIVLNGISVVSLVAQNSSRMLIHEIEDNQYVKVDYSSEGRQTGKQVLKVDNTIEKQKDLLRVPVRLYSYSVNGEMVDSTKTIYTCNPDERRILVNLLSFSDCAKGNEIKVNIKGTNAFYPVEPEPGWKMESFEFEMNVDKGVVGFLGGKSKIKIYDWRVVSNDSLQAGQYEVTSRVNLGVYVLGLKIRGLDYNVTEIVDEERGLIYQKFVSQNDGSYFVIRLLYEPDVIF